MTDPKYLAPHGDDEDGFTPPTQTVYMERDADGNFERDADGNFEAYTEIA